MSGIGYRSVLGLNWTILILIRIGQLHETLEHTLRSCLITYTVCGERVEGGGGPGWNSTWCRHHKWERSGGTTSLEQLQEQDGSSRWEPEGGSYENPIDEWNPWIWFWCWENSLDSIINIESLQEQTKIDNWKAHVWVSQSHLKEDGRMTWDHLFQTYTI